MVTNKAEKEFFFIAYFIKQSSVILFICSYCSSDIRNVDILFFWVHFDQTFLLVLL